MKKELNLFATWLLFAILFLTLESTTFAQEDNPLFDRVPQEWLDNINYSDSEQDVVTDNDGYDNFNLGIDFAEPHLSQNPNNPRQYFGAYNINNAWRTSDGHNWQNSTPNFGTSANGDPGTAYDGVGNLYYETMFGGITGCKVMRSTDNGLTWSSPVTAISGNDKNWMAADQTTGPYANYVYTTMTPGNFARSTNFGATWTTTATFATQALPGMMVCVGPNGSTDGGAVYVVTNSGNAFASTYTFYVSTNGGLNFTLKSAQNFANYVGTNVNGRNSVQNMRTRPYPFITADQSTGSFRGRFYCIYASNTPSGNGNKPDIFCRYSTDQGTTWSAAIKINDDLNSQNHHQWHPSVWCDRSTGRLYVKWMDTRNTPTSDSAYIYASYSDNGGVTWAANSRISNQKMKIDCSTCGGGGTPRYQGDYDAIVSNNNQSLMMWTDFRDGNFGSYVAYFPDFAMKLPTTSTTIVYNNDSAFININIPGVKLYNSTVLLSASVSPAPTSGSIVLDFPQGNTINSFPSSKNLRIRTSGYVPTGTYTINIQGEGPNGTPVHRRTATLDVILPVLDFNTNFVVTDNCLNSFSLQFGTAPGATDCFDLGLDQSAPPPPPAGAFDTRFVICSEHLFTDIRATNLSTERTWQVSYVPATGCSPMSFSWNPAQLPADGYFHLVDPVFGNLVNVNMRTTNHYTDVLGLGLLRIKYNYEICSNFNIANGWNMLSLPTNVANNNFQTLFPTAVPGSLYGYSNGYFSTESILNGIGYWLKFNSPQTAQVCGNDTTESVLFLNNGWNMIGGPNCNVPIGDVIDPGNIIVAGTLYGYNGSYFNSNSVDGTKAYWIKTNSAGSITISCGEFLSKESNPLSISEEILSEFSSIGISDRMQNNQTLYFNAKLNNGLSLENFSLPPVPPPGGFDARIIGDYRLSEDEEVNIVVQATEYPLILTLNNIRMNEEYVIQEFVDGIEIKTHIAVKESETIVIENEKVSMLKITKKQSSLPTSFNLEQNYPNPFNPITIIRFSLPEDANNVKLVIYNALGERIAELVNANLPAGRYSFQWDAGNFSSGIYLYELKSDKFVSTKKMIVLK